MLRCLMFFMFVGLASAAYAVDGMEGMQPSVFPPPPKKAQTAKEAKPAKEPVTTLKKVEIIPPGYSGPEGGESPSPRPSRAVRDPFEEIVADTNGTVLPEVPTSVRMSNAAVNRITCSTNVQDVIWSDEKPVKVKWVDKDVFIKFQPMERDTDGKRFYPTDPIDLYIKCGGATYTVIAVPDYMQMQTIRLISKTPENIKQNADLYAGMPFERKIVSLVRTIYTDNIPDSFTVKKYDAKFNVFKEIDLTLKKVVRIEGEGLLVKEYLVTLHDPAVGQRLELDERMFLNSEVASRAVGISAIPPILTPGSVSRLLVVEQGKEGDQ